MDAHISKPVDMQILKSVVQNIKSGGGGVPQKDITENKWGKFVLIYSN